LLPTATEPKLSVLGLMSKGEAIPVPVMGAESGPTVRVADLAPAEVGLKEAIPVQVAPAAREEPQVELPTIRNCVASVPLMAGAVREMAAVPGLLTVNARLLGDPTGTPPKLNAAGVMAGLVVAVPVRVMVAPARTQTAVLLPPEVGAKNTTLVHEAPAASDGPQLEPGPLALNWSTSPVAEVALVLRSDEDVLVIVRVRVAEVLPTLTEPKLSVDGVMVR
jgi:hypothetical protein